MGWRPGSIKLINQYVGKYLTINMVCYIKLTMCEDVVFLEWVGYGLLYAKPNPFLLNKIS